jgi:YD repeat-containing protein
MNKRSARQLLTCCGSIFIIISLFVCLTVPIEASAQAGTFIEYCTENPYYPSPPADPPYHEGCFGSYAEAEAFMKREANPAVGRSLLEEKSQTPGISGTNITVSYYVPPRSPDEKAADVYSTRWIGGAGLGPYGCGTNEHAFLSLSQDGCDSLSSLEDVILSHEGPGVCVWFYGSYAQIPLAGWFAYQPNGGYQAWGDRGLVAGLLDAPDSYPPPSFTRYSCVDPPPPPYNANAHWTANRQGWFWCPTYFHGRDWSNDPANWATTCTNGEIGTISTRFLQSENCEVGNPCVPASGAKIQKDIDFSWGKLRFARTYNSLSQLSSNAYLGNTWTHVLAAHLWKINSSLFYLVDETNQLERFDRIGSSTKYKSANVAGKVLDVPVGGSATVTYSNGDQWIFDTTTANYGRLTGLHYPDTPADDLSLSYCETDDFVSDACNVPHALTVVTDGRGRALRFTYRAGAYSQDTPPKYFPPRLENIVSGSTKLVAYDYDDQQRLSHVFFMPDFPEATYVTYLYGESSNLCQDGNGNTTVPCATLDSPNLLTGKIDEAGHRYLNVTYDGLGRVTSTAHPGNVEKTSLAYYGSDAIVTMPDGETRTYTYGVQLFPRLSDYVVAGAGQVFTSHRNYDASNRLYQLTDARGVLSEYGYDDLHLISNVEAKATTDQRTTVTGWDSTSNRNICARDSERKL